MAAKRRTNLTGDNRTMARPASPARALHDIINAVNSGIGDPHSHAYYAWQDVAGHDIGTSAFVRFHAEVMELLSEVSEEMRTLSHSAEQRFSIYIDDWWSALVRPRQDWAADKSKIIEPAPLHMLAALADVFEARAPQGGAHSPQTPELLARAVTFLREEVANATDLPESVRDEILNDLDHVLWLLDEVDTFGVGHAVGAMEKATGRALSKAARTPSKSLKTVAVGLVAALALIRPATADLAEIVSNVKQTFGITAESSGASEHAEVVQSTVVRVYNECVPRQLTAGRADTPEGETVEGEVVDDLEDAVP